MEAERQLGSQSASTVAHSLGSMLLSEVGRSSKEATSCSKPVTPLGRRLEGEYVVKTSSDPLSWFHRPKQDQKSRATKSTSVSPLCEHSADRLGALRPDEVIGKGLKVKELKSTIKEHSKRSKSQVKVKGYGTVKKAELQEAAHHTSSVA